MGSLRLLFSFSLLLLSSVYAFGESDNSQCFDDNMNFCESVECLRGEMDKYDRLLNSNYKSLMKSLPQDQAARLKFEQIQWVKKYAKFKKDLEDGDTGVCSSVLQYLGAEVEYVKKRALELEKMAK